MPPLTRQEILTRWPSAALRPAPITLWRWLARACELKVLIRQGDGNKADPFRHGLATAEQEGT